MPAVPLVALKSHRYAGRLVTPGEFFSARTSDDARVLKALKFAQDAPALPSPPVPEDPPPVPVEVVVADNGTPGEDHAEEPEGTAPAQPMRTKRTYRRRDMTAEDK